MLNRLMTSLLVVGLIGCNGDSLQGVYPFSDVSEVDVYLKRCQGRLLGVGICDGPVTNVGVQHFTVVISQQLVIPHEGWVADGRLRNCTVVTPHTWGCSDNRDQPVTLTSLGLAAPWLDKNEFSVSKSYYYGFWGALLH